MYLPKNEREYNRLQHGSPSATRGFIAGNQFADKYHRMRPKVSLASILTTGDSLLVNKAFYDVYAYKLAFVVRYMNMEGYKFPFLKYAEKQSLVTSDQEYERNDGMLNKIMLIGNLGKDPELVVTGDGTPITKFSLAVSRSYTTSSGEKRQETEWFNIVMWRKLAEIADQYLHKGSKVYIEGRLNQRQYVDRDGNKRTSVEVTADQMEMLTPKNEGNGHSGGEQGTSDDAFMPDYPVDVT
jgi:single-strand DNA-binding protein